MRARDPRRAVNIVKLQVYCPLEAYAWDVRPVEQGIRCYSEAKQYHSRGDGEEGGEVCANGGLGENDAEWTESEALLTLAMSTGGCGYVTVP